MAAVLWKSTADNHLCNHSLANVEMRIILAKMLWHFDLRLEEESKYWTNQKVYLIWAKPPLKVKLTPVKR